MRVFGIEAFPSPGDAAGAWGDFAKQELPARCEVLVSLPYSKAGDEHLRLIAQGPRVRSLVLDGTQITDTGLMPLRAMSYLKTLSLGGTGVSDAGARVLADVRSLRYLDLRQTRLSNASLPSLAALAQLESLDLSGTDVDGAGLVHLAKLRNLQTLVLKDLAVGDRDVPALLTISSLRELHLRGTDITESGAAQLGGRVAAAHSRIRGRPPVGSAICKLWRARRRNLKMKTNFSGKTSSRREFNRRLQCGPQIRTYPAGCEQEIVIGHFISAAKPVVAIGVALQTDQLRSRHVPGV